MPNWVWIGIFVVGTPVIGVLLALLVKRGGTISLGKAGSYVVHGQQSEEESTALGRALHFVPNHIGEIHSLFFEMFLKIAVKKGVSKDEVTERTDTKFFYEIMENAVTAGNGSSSVQKIIENEIVSRDWVGESVENYVRHTVIPRIIDSVRKRVSTRYDTEAHDTHDNRRIRLVTQAEYIEMLLLPETKDALADLVKPFFENAVRCFEEGC